MLNKCKCKQNKTGGQLFTNWICGICGITFVHSNNNTPKLCQVCATHINVCRWCGKEAEEK